MADLEYRLEFTKDDKNASDSAVFIHLRRNPPIYQDRIDKEDYDILDESEKNAFTTGLIEIAGVVEISLKAYRIWMAKSPVYEWEEILLPVLFFIKDFFGDDDLEQLPGSANPDGTGIIVEPSARRPI